MAWNESRVNCTLEEYEARAGRWRYNPATGEFERLSDGPRKEPVFDCFVPEGGYLSQNLGRDPKHPIWVRSRAHKRKLLARRGLREME